MEVFKYILPAFIVMMTAYLLFDKMILREEKKQKLGQEAEKKSGITVIRLRAYERLMLVLERTNPETMVMHVIRPGMSCIEFQTGLLDFIRKEYEHNYSQQIYVSDELWKLLTFTRANLVKLVNTAASHFRPDEPAAAMAETIIKMYVETEHNPTQQTIQILKSEIREQFFI
jgi:hypothetical protein